MLEGVIVPLITPFRKDGELFREAFDPLLDFLIKRGVSGFFLCGTYETGPLLTLDKRKNVVELVMERVKADLKAIMVGDAVELAPAVQSTFEVLRMRGVDVGYPKPPLRMLTDEEKMKVKDALRKLEMI